MRETDLIDMDFQLVDVKSVTPLAGYSVRLVFSDGMERNVDLEPYLKGPIFEQVRDPDYFRQIRVDRDSGTISWPNGADIDPLTLRYNLMPAWKEDEAEIGIERYVAPEFFTVRSGAKLFSARSILFLVFTVAALVPILIVGLVAGKVSSWIVVAALIAQPVLLVLFSGLELLLQRQSQRAAIMLVDHLPRVSFVGLDPDGQIRIVVGGRRPISKETTRSGHMRGPAKSTEFPG